MRPRWVLATCVAAVVGLALLAVPATRMALASLGSRSKAVAAGAGPSQPETRNVQIVAQAPPPPPTLRAPASPGAVRYGLCVANGTAAGPKWTPWLLETMKHVRGGVNDQISVTQQGGRWGIIDGLPPQLASQVSIKNGWTVYGDGWHVNCLAIEQDWVLNVMVRIGSLQAAANTCRSVAEQLIYNPDI